MMLDLQRRYSTDEILATELVWQRCAPTCDSGLQVMLRKLNAYVFVWFDRPGKSSPVKRAINPDQPLRLVNQELLLAAYVK